MKRSGVPIEEICAFENLLLAAERAQAGKRYRPEVLRFNLRLEDGLLSLRREILDGSYRPLGHRHFRVEEPKARWISAAPYRDRVVHHAVCNVIEPILDRGLIFDCWANRRGKGSHRAVLRYQGLAAKFRYALKMDVRKYFPSIDCAILGAQLRTRFKDERLLELLGRIIDLGENPEAVHEYFRGDDLFTPYERRKGLPIGNLTSQLFGNVYLDEFDHWVKEELRAPAYLRFVDDFVLLHDSADHLRQWLLAIAERLAGVRLKLHERKCVIRRTAEGLPFLGYVVWPGRIRIRGETVRRFRRRIARRRKRGSEGETIDRARSMAAWKGHVGLAGDFRTVGALR